MLSLRLRFQRISRRDLSQPLLLVREGVFFPEVVVEASEIRQEGEGDLRRWREGEVQWVRMGKENDGEDGEDGVEEVCAGADKDGWDEREADAGAP